MDRVGPSGVAEINIKRIDASGVAPAYMNRGEGLP